MFNLQSVTIINLDTVIETFKLNLQETLIIEQAIQPDSKINTLSSIIFNTCKTVVGKSDWQKGVHVLSSKIQGKNRKAAAHFLLCHLLTQHTFICDHCPKRGLLASPISYENWTQGNLRNATIENVLDICNCKI